MSGALHVLDRLPPALTDHAAPDLHRVLPGPTLLELPGRAGRPLFTAVLQHGNETVGWEAARRLLREYRNRELPRPWALFIGNVAAARHGLRHLEGEPDFNRSWPGSETGGTGVHRALSELTERMRRARPAASVDVHGNTGLNPHFAVVNETRPDVLALAALFGDTAVHFTRPAGVQSKAFAAFCPALTVECGQVGSAPGVAHAHEFLRRCLEWDGPLPRAPGRDLRLYRTVARLTVPAHLAFGFGEPATDVDLRADLDRLNFVELKPFTELARVAPGRGPGVLAHDDRGRDVTGRYLVERTGRLLTAVPIMPIMLTRDRLVIRQDCLGYLMENDSALAEPTAMTTGRR